MKSVIQLAIAAATVLGGAFAKPNIPTASSTTAPIFPGPTPTNAATPIPTSDVETPTPTYLPTHLEPTYLPTYLETPMPTYPPTTQSTPLAIPTSDPIADTRTTDAPAAAAVAIPGATDGDPLAAVFDVSAAVAGGGTEAGDAPSSSASTASRCTIVAFACVVFAAGILGLGLALGIVG